MAKRFSTDGVNCPCCDGLAKVYPRTFNKTMARILVQMYLWDHDEPSRFRHVKEEWPYKFGTFNPEYARMVDLGLIEEPDEARDDGNPNTGYHRITHKGIRFVRGEVTIARRVFCYKGNVIEEDEGRITISDAMKRPFHYRELWA